MKILFLFPHFTTHGGAANVVLQFARGLQQRGHITEILCAKATDEFVKENSDVRFTELNIPTSNSAMYWLFFPYWQYRIHKKLDTYPDYILFPHVLPSNWWAWIYKRICRTKPIVWYCHEPSAFIHSKPWIRAIPNRGLRLLARMLNPVLQQMDRKLEKGNDIVICNSNYTQEAYGKVYQRKAACVIYPPIHLKYTDVQDKKENYFLSVSRITKFKNVHVLIDAFEIFVKRNPDYRLYIAGEGEEKENLQNSVTRRNLATHVFFWGKLNDQTLETFYRQARATILCSREEPFGLVPVESMMYGTPVIAHNSGGPLETIVHNKSGFLFTHDRDLADYLEIVAGMADNEYKIMQTHCRESVKKFDIETALTNLENVFLRLTEKIK